MPRIHTSTVAAALGASKWVSAGAAQVEPGINGKLAADVSGKVLPFDRMIFGQFLEPFHHQIDGGVFDPGPPLADKKASGSTLFAPNPKTVQRRTGRSTSGRRLMGSRNLIFGAFETRRMLPSFSPGIILAGCQPSFSPEWLAFTISLGVLAPIELSTITSASRSLIPTLLFGSEHRAKDSATRDILPQFPWTRLELWQFEI